MEQTFDKSNANEALLKAWLRLSTSVINERIVSEMSYNESLICSLLYQNTKTGHTMTATELCQETKILKSQMNRTLNQMEAKNMITRERASDDKRKVLIHLDMTQSAKYEKQHREILRSIDCIIDKLGVEKTAAAIALLTDIADIASEVFQPVSSKK